MATVPRKTQAGDIRPTRTTLPGITQFRGLDAPAKALTGLGQAVSGAGEDIADVGARIQLGDETRELSTRDLAIRQTLSDYTDGNEEKGIVGWKSLEGEEAVRKAEGIKQEMRTAVDAILKGVEAEWVRRELKLKAEGHLSENGASHDIYNIDQRRVARDTLYKGKISQSRKELNTAIPGDIQSEGKHLTGIMIVSARMADEAGIEDQTTREEFIKAELTVAHEAKIDTLQAAGQFSAAQAYYDRNISSIIASKQGAILKKVQTGSVVAEAQAEFDTIVLSDPAGLSTSASRLAAAREIVNPVVRKETITMIRAHNADLARQTIEGEKDVRRDGIAAANKGILVSEMSIETQDVISRTVGLTERLDKTAIRVKEGRVIISDPEVRGKYATMLRNDPAAFSEVDFTSEKKLSQKDMEYFEKQQLGLSRDDIREAKQTQKDAEATARLSRARSATQGLVKQLKVSNAYLGDIDLAMTAEIERRTAEGEKLQDSDYQDIYRSLYLLRGEEPGGAFLGLADKDVRLFQAIADRAEFEMGDFSDKNKALIESMSATAGVDPVTGARLASVLIKQGTVPTADTIRQEFNLRVAALPTPAVAPAITPAATTAPAAVTPVEATAPAAVTPVEATALLWDVAYQGDGMSAAKRADFISDINHYKAGADQNVVKQITDTVAQVFTGDENVDIVKLQNAMIDIALHESNGFQYRKQLRGGPARGIHQVEPKTALNLITTSILLGAKAKAMLKAEGLDISKKVTKAEIARALEQSDIVSTIFATAKLLSGAKAQGRLGELQ